MRLLRWFWRLLKHLAWEASVPPPFRACGRTATILHGLWYGRMTPDQARKKLVAWEFPAKGLEQMMALATRPPSWWSQQKARGNAVLEYRVTKYDPALRDQFGHYTRDEWTSISDIGRSFADSGALTAEEYQRVEDAYVSVAVGFLRESGQETLTVTGLEYHGATPLDFEEGSVLGLKHAAEVIRSMLREELWCRLEGPKAFVHVGYDYYLYVGVPRACPEAEATARQLGLFVEEYLSPYRSKPPSGP